MMCHPVTCDVLHIRRDRVLSGVCIRRGLRSGGDVLDLYGRLSGGSEGHGADGSPEAPLRVAGKTAICGQELISTQVAASKKHTLRFRVYPRELPFAFQPKGDSRHLVTPLKRFGAFPLRNFRSQFLESAGASVSFARSPEYLDSEHQDVAPPAHKAPQTFPPSSMVCTESVADAGSPYGMRSRRPQVFCSRKQRNATAGQISTGASHTNTEGVRSQTSDMVLVTTQGTVLASLQLIPRG